MSDKMNLDKISDEVIQDLFTEVFEPVGSDNNVTEFECTCKRAVGSSKVKMEVMIIGLAGSPTYDDLHSEIVEGLETITISREGDGSLDFEREPDADYILNTNDYVISYQTV